MSVKITTNQNTVTVADADKSITIINNREPNRIDIVQPESDVIYVAALGPQGPAGTGGGGSSDLTALNSFSASILTFTGSIQTQVNSLTAATSSYILASTTSSMIVSGALTASYYAETDPIFVAKSASLATTGSNTFTGDQIIDGENLGLIIDASGLKRVGFMKYGGLEGSIARVANQNFRILRTTGSDINDGTSAITDFYIAGDGKIGIGTTSPAYTLDVSGSSNFTGDTLITGSLYQLGTFFPNQIDWFSSSIGYDTGSYILTTTTNGLTTYANYQDVANTLNPYIPYVTTSSFNNFTSSYNTGSFTGSFSGSFIGTASWAESASQALTASHAPSYLLLTGGIIDGNVTVNGTASVAFLHTTYVTSSVVYSSGSNQFGDDATDTQTLYGTIIISGSQQITGSLNAPTITGSLHGTSSWAESASNAIYAQTASFLPTGTYQITASWATNASQATSASYVTGSIFVGTNLALSASFATSSSFASTASLSTGIAGGTTNYITKWTTNTTLGVGGIFENGFGQVGIGTAIPNTTLHISASSAQPLLNIENATANGYTNMRFTGTGRKYIIGVGNASETTFGIANDFFLYDDTSGNVRMVVDSTGRVGIGTTAPSYTLDVNGTANVTGDMVITGSLYVANEISGIQGQITALAQRNYLFSGF